jgi:hypothetical protein
MNTLIYIYIHIYTEREREIYLFIYIYIYMRETERERERERETGGILYSIEYAHTITNALGGGLPARNTYKFWLNLVGAEHPSPSINERVYAHT